MASAAQIDAFAWWLKQRDKNARSARSVQEKFGVSVATSKTWVAEFNAELASRAKKSVSIQLRARVAEYDAGSEIAATSGLALAQVFESKIAEIKRNPSDCKVSELVQLTSGLKACYQLIEAASGADLAKKQALQSGEASGSAPSRLPALSSALSVLDVEAETVSETDSGNDSGNESPSPNPGSLEKSGLENSGS